MLFCALTMACSLLAAAPQDPEKAAAFSAEMTEAMEVGDTGGVTKALRKYKEDAILLFISKAAVRATSDDPELNDWVDAFVDGWSKAFRNDFARNYDRYLQRLSADGRRVRLQLLQTDYPRINNQHIAALNKDPDVLWNDLRTNADTLVTAMIDVGDLYYLALAQNIVGNLNNPIYREDGADGLKAVAAYEGCIAAREKLGLTNDRFYTNTYRVLRDLRGRMGIPEPVDPNAPPPEEPEINPEEMQPTAEMEAVTVPLEAGLLKKPEAQVHSADFERDQFVSWVRVGLPVPGEQITLPDIMPPVRLKRVAAAKYQLEAGGEPSEEFRLTPKPTAVTVMRRFADGSERPYTLEVATGTTSEVFQGVTLNLEPTDEGGPMFFRSISTMTGETPYGPVTLIDFNGDGAFGLKEFKPAANWAEGLLPETFFLRPDAIVFGEAKHSWPFSRFIADEKGQWYELEMEAHEAPTEVVLTPVTPNLGKLEVEFKGLKKVKLASLILASESSATKGLVVDLAAMKDAKGAYQLPIGRYRFIQARWRDAKNGGSVLVLPASGIPTFLDVDQTDTVKLELGAPFRFAAQVDYDGDQAVVNGRSLHVVGRSGERYLRVIGEPLFGIEASAKGAKSAELKAPEPEDTNQDWERLYYPMDAVLETKGDKPAVTLSLKKHPWFGKISTVLGE